MSWFAYVQQSEEISVWLIWSRYRWYDMIRYERGACSKLHAFPCPSSSSSSRSVCNLIKTTPLYSLAPRTLHLLWSTLNCSHLTKHPASALKTTEWPACDERATLSSTAGGASSKTGNVFLQRVAQNINTFSLQALENFIKLGKMGAVCLRLLTGCSFYLLGVGRCCKFLGMLAG